MWDFVLNWIIDPVSDLFLCDFRWGNWLKHLIVSGLLTLLAAVFVALLVLGWQYRNWVLGILGLAGTIVFGYIVLRYEWWWFREGRHMN